MCRDAINRVFTFLFIFFMVYISWGKCLNKIKNILVVFARKIDDFWLVVGLQKKYLFYIPKK
jgi:hypothetical protein